MERIVESYDYVLNGSPITFAIIEVDGVFVDLAVFDSNIMDFGLYTDVTTARDVLYSVIGYLGLTPPPTPIAPVPTPTPPKPPIPVPPPTPITPPPPPPPPPIKYATTGLPEYEYRFVPPPPPSTLSWATKGYWEFGPKGQLLAPITIGDVKQELMTREFRGYARIPDYIIDWYKRNYPEYF
jgi:hypothetical protein